MPTVRDTAIPLADYSGTITMPSSAVPDWVSRISLTVGRCTTATPDLWPDEGVTLAMDFEISMDSGASWRPFASFLAKGGVQLDKAGAEASESGLSRELPPGSGRRLRGSAMIAGGTLRTQGYIEVS